VVVIRPSRGSLLTVSISRTDAEEWEDPKYREDFKKAVETRAKARGRRYFEVRNDRGLLLHVGEVAQ
jgi:hypothetical protein